MISYLVKVLRHSFVTELRKTALHFALFTAVFLVQNWVLGSVQTTIVTMVAIS